MVVRVERDSAEVCRRERARVRARRGQTRLAGRRRLPWRQVALARHLDRRGQALGELADPHRRAEAAAFGEEHLVHEVGPLMEEVPCAVHDHQDVRPRLSRPATDGAEDWDCIKSRSRRKRVRPQYQRLLDAKRTLRFDDDEWPSLTQRAVRRVVGVEPDAERERAADVGGARASEPLAGLAGAAFGRGGEPLFSIGLGPLGVGLVCCGVATPAGDAGAADADRDDPAEPTAHRDARGGPRCPGEAAAPRRDTAHSCTVP
mmetsp:Transcript_4768/g.15165  ORF Transcript_4768/g.15165 Transcript_4768/m.15165 type:complete len:260 (-) Transcript_4768:4-783(-)